MENYFNKKSMNILKNQQRRIFGENKITTSYYTKYNFIPYNLYNQFSKYSNLFFLITLILLCIPNVSPFTPYTYLIALLFIILLAMIKDGIEDYKRHLNDHIINKQKVKNLTFSNNSFEIEEIFTEDINIFNYIILEKNEEVPADGIFLMAFTKKGCENHCYVETSKIDGEETIKKKYSNSEINCKCEEEDNFIDCASRVLENIKNIYFTKSRNNLFIDYREESDDILETENNIVRRGTLIKSNKILIVTTKVERGRKYKRNAKSIKISTFQKLFDERILIIFYIFAIFLILSSILTVWSLVYIKLDSFYYATLQSILTNFIILSPIIPLSLLFQLEILRIIFKLYCKYFDHQNTFIDVKNTNIIEEMGNINTIICDKTGTLTQNEFNFLFYNIMNGKYKNTKELFSEVLREEYILYVMGLLVCNSATIDNQSIENISQDENSILKILLRNIKNVKKDAYNISFIFLSHQIKGTIIATLPFISKNKRMAVLFLIDSISGTKKIFLNLRQRYFIFSKGSRTIFDFSIEEMPKDFYNKRELILAHRELTDKNLIEQIANEENKISKLDERIFFTLSQEKMKLLGVVLLEDKLQDNIFETLSIFNNIFIVTGDKRETTEAISKSIGLKIEWSKTYRELDDQIYTYQSKRNYNFYYYKNRFEHRSTDKSCKIIYSSLPHQKKKIVDKIKESVAAVGDGFNDIEMIQRSTIGIGISGREGNAASNCADVKINEINSLIPFTFLSREAYYAFARLSFLSIFKNVYMLTIQFCYFFFCNNIIFTGTFLSWYNILYTSLIPICESIFGRNICKQFNGNNYLILNKTLDIKIAEEQFSLANFYYSLIFSFISAIFTFFGAFFIFDCFYTISLEEMQLIFNTITFLTIILTQISYMSRINIYYITAILLSLLFYITTIPVYKIFEYSFEIILIVLFSMNFLFLRTFLFEKYIKNL